MRGVAAANLFEGLNDTQAKLWNQTISQSGSNGNPCYRGLIGVKHAVIQCDALQTATLVAFTAQSPAPTSHLAGANQESANSDEDCNPFKVNIQASYSSLVQPHHGAVMLQACHQGSRHVSTCLSGLQLPCWLTLYKSGSSLELYAVQQPQQQPSASSPGGHVVLALEHDSLQSVTAQQCWLFPGPTLLLHPEAEQLLFVSPLDTLSATEPACTSAVSPRSAVSCSSQPFDQQWQLTELHLTSQALMCQLDLQCLEQLLQDNVAGTIPTWTGGGQAAKLDLQAQPYQLLHCQADGDKVQVLISMLVATTAAKEADKTDTAALGQRQEGQHQMSLLLRLEVDLAGGVAADPPVDGGGSAIRLVCCYATGWEDIPACAAVAEAGDGQQQVVVIGNSAGVLHQLLCTQRNPVCSRQQQQLQDGQLSTALPHSNSVVSLQSRGRVRGAICGIHVLPEVLLAGAVQRDVIAVQHQPNDHDSDITSAITTVTLLLERAGQLQAVAEIPSVRGFLAPDGCSPWGLLCPWQTHSAEAGQAAATSADSNALQLAALLFLDQQNGEAVVKAASALKCCAYAQLSMKETSTLAGPVLGLVKWLPSDLMLGSEQQQQQQSEGCSVEHALANKNTTAAASLNALRGLQTMASVLEAHWQRECVDMAALQHRLSNNLRLAAAAHAHLCQVAADTIQTSTAHQYSTSQHQLDSRAALVAYTTGRHIQQQQESQQLDMQGSSNFEGCCLQLTLKTLGHSVQLTADELQLVVQVKPVVQLKHQGGGSGTNPSGKALRSWWGPLVQVCHAELLLWHTDGLAVASQTNWQWDVVAGVVTVQATISKNQLLNLAQQQRTCSGISSISISRHQARLVQEGGKTSSLQDQYVGVAEAIAAAVNEATGSNRNLEQAYSNDSSLNSASSACLRAAVVVAACCSSQAAAQMQVKQRSSNKQGYAYAEEVLLCCHLLTPRTALLHLPAVKLSLQQLLLPPQGGRTAGVRVHQSPQQNNSKGQQRQGTEVGVLQTPAEDVLLNQHSPSHTTAHCSEPQGPYMGFTSTDVVPPTPYEDTEMMQKDADQQYQDEMVVEDSQPDDEPAAPKQQVPVVNCSPRTIHDDVTHDLQGQDLPEQEQRQLHMEVQSQQYDKQLLLRGPAAAIHQVLVVLVERHGLQLWNPAAAAALNTAVADTAHDQYHLAIVLDRLQRQHDGVPVHVHLRPTGRVDNHDSSSIELVSISSDLLHVVLRASSSQQLQLLQLVLAAAAQQSPEGEGVVVEVSPLSSNRHASLLAATDAIGQAVHIHSRVISDVQQQSYAQQQQQPFVEAHRANVQQVAAAAHNIASGCPAAVSGAAGAVDTKPSSVCNDQGGVLQIDGMLMGHDLSQCWVSLCQSQALVDLAVSQLAAHK